MSVRTENSYSGLDRILNSMMESEQPIHPQAFINNITDPTVIDIHFDLTKTIQRRRGLNSFVITSRNPRQLGRIR